MKMTLRLLVTALALTLLSCGDDDSETLNIPDISQEDCMAKHFYYDSAVNENVSLGDRIAYDRVLIGFYNTVANSHITATLNTQEELKNVADSDIVALHDYKYVAAVFRTPKTCPEIYAFIEMMKTKTAVAYGSYVYEGGIDYNVSATAFSSYTDQFSVRVTDTNDLTALQAVANETGTVLGDTVGDGIFLMSVDKNAAGNALDMANYFMQTGHFLSAKPVFKTWSELP